VTAEARVTSGHASYDPIFGYKINRDQTIASFFSKAFPNPVEVHLRKNAMARGSQEVPSYAVTFGQRGVHDGQISLLRTPRVPEDGLHYDIPQGLGTLPIYDVRSFSGDLPVSMVAKGGVFVAMHGK